MQGDRSVYQGKHTRDGQRQERDEKNTQDPRTGMNHKRRSVKEETDLWSGVRQMKTPLQEENERLSRRNGDKDYSREKEGGGDQKRERGLDNHRRSAAWENNGESTEKRNGPLRSREVASWSREEDRKASRDDHTEKPGTKDFRDNDRKVHRGQERGWSRGGQHEADPAWSKDDSEPEEKRQAATQADFEQWRAQMRAGKEERKISDVSTVGKSASHDRAESIVDLGAAKGKVDKPLDLGVGDDKFFDLLSRPKREKTRINGHENDSNHESVNTPAEVARSSKFSSLFVSNTPPDAAMAPVHNPSPEGKSIEDKVGFQRILNLLGQQQEPDVVEPTPQEPLTKYNTQKSAPVQSPRGGEPNNLQSFVSPQSPPSDKTPKPTDGEFLLNLMRHPQQDRDNPPHVYNGNPRLENTPGMLPFSNLMLSPRIENLHSTPSSGPPQGYFEEPPSPAIAQKDKLNPNAQNQRGPPPGIYDLFNNPSRPQPAGLPPGLERRPPGIDHMPPGFGQPPQQQRQNMAPPPGFPPPQRVHGAVAPGMFGSRPNGLSMPPPPGFMNMGGHPPPGFSPMGFGHEGPPFGNGGYDYVQGFHPPGQKRR